MRVRPTPMGEYFVPNRFPDIVHACRATARAARVAAVGLALAAGWGAPAAVAHSGDFDEYGGHFDERTGGYHYHKPKWDMAKRTKEYLGWIEEGKSGELLGVVAQVKRPDALWVHIPYRPAYQVLAHYISAQNRDDERARIKIWFSFVSPERSALSQNKEYVAWFRKKLVYELDRKLRGKNVTVQFRIVGPSGRMRGMVMQERENINIWLVLNGWSFLVLDDEVNPHQESFAEAETVARNKKAGLWGR